MWCEEKNTEGEQERKVLHYYQDKDTQLVLPGGEF